MSLLLGSWRISHGKGSTICKYQSLNKTDIRDVFVQNNIYEPTLTGKKSWLQGVTFFQGKDSEFYVKL